MYSFGLFSFRRIEIMMTYTTTIPGVVVCPHCDGTGHYEQRYIEGRWDGPCNMCKAACYVYEHSGKGVPSSD